jgi:hypothetical protein
VVLERRSEAQIELRLGAGARLVGRLVDARDRPLAGRVGLGELDGQPAPHELAGTLAGEAGPDGRFALEMVPAGQHRLGVVAPGHAVQMVDVAVRGAERQVDVGDVRLEVGLAIRGRVRDRSGQPVEGAMLRATPARRWEGPLPTALSEADGSFVLAGLQQTPYRIMADAADYARADQPAEPGGDPVEIVLERGALITGRVVDDRSRTIEDFSVVAHPVEQGAFRRFPRPSDVTIADGQFTMQGLAEGAYALTVSSPERAPTTVSGVRVAAGATVDVGTVTLAGGGVVRGTVVDDTGASVAGACVTVRGQGRGWSAFGGNEPQATTETGGAFEVKGVRAGSAQVTASHPNYASSEPSFVEVDPGKGVSDVRLVLSQGGRVAGSVRRRDGTALSGVQVRVSASRPGRGLGNDATSPVQADGSFAVEHVPAGRATVLVMPSSSRGSDLGGLSRAVEVRDGETTTVDIVARDILLSGRATRSGTPAPGLQLEAAARGRFPGELVGLGASGGPQRLNAVTREDGSFEMLLDEPGTVILAATSADGRTRLPSRTIEVPDADAHSVELRYDGVVVSGIVVDQETDAPLPFAAVMAAPKPAGPGGSGGTAGQDGRFQLELEPGAYRLIGRVRDEGYGTAEAEVSVGASGVSDVKLALPKGLAIAGRVTDGAGRPVGGVQLFAHGTAAATFGDTGWGESLADGTFSIGGLKSGSFVVTAGTDAGQFAMLPNVAAGSKNLSLALRPGASLDVSIVGPEGEPISGAWPRVTRLDGVLVQSMGRAQRPTDGQGLTAMIVPAGQVFVGAQQGPLTGGTQIEIGPGERAALRITLHRKPEGAGQ